MSTSIQQEADARLMIVAPVDQVMDIQAGVVAPVDQEMDIQARVVGKVAPESATRQVIFAVLIRESHPIRT